MSDPLAVALLVEDERQIRRFVRTALEAQSWVVHEAETLSIPRSVQRRAGGVAEPEEVMAEV